MPTMRPKISSITKLEDNEVKPQRNIDAHDATKVHLFTKLEDNEVTPRSAKYGHPRHHESSTAKMKSEVTPRWPKATTNENSRCSNSVTTEQATMNENL